MAIFHFSVKAISRSAGRSAVACSAYRSGEKLEDHYQGKIQDYTQKTGVESKSKTNYEFASLIELFCSLRSV